MQDLIKRLEDHWSKPNVRMTDEIKPTVETCMDLLERGEIRVAEYNGGQWRVNAWVKRVIMMFFEMQPKTYKEAGHSCYFDVVPGL